MSLLAWLLGLLLPACGAIGAHGLPVPPPLDMAQITRPATPNAALAAPGIARRPSPPDGAGGAKEAKRGREEVPSRPLPPPSTPKQAETAYILVPDLVTPIYHVPAAQLFEAIRAVAAAQPRTYPAAAYPDRLQADWVARSAVFNFPDLITAQVTPAGADAATLVLYSRSVYGYSDLGVNRRRVQAWLAALPRILNPANER